MFYTAFLRKEWPIIALMAAVFITRFCFLAWPAQTVFDEVYFGGQFANAYATGEYYFDVHPPLGKLLIFGVTVLLGQSQNLDISTIGNAAPALYFVARRFLPALLGSLLPLVIYLILRKIHLSRKAAFLGAFLVAFDNAILVQSKFALLDVMLLFFGFTAIYFFLCHQEESHFKKSLLLLLLSGILVTFCASIKWTGLLFFGIIELLALVSLIAKFSLKKLVLYPICLILVPFCLYYGIFMAHFALLPRPGPGNAYMSAQFATLSPWGKFLELNQKMYYYNSTLKATHPYSSHWYQWPFDRRPIWYWSSTQNGASANIYLLGNPVIWWAVLATVIASLAAICFKNLRQKLPWIFYLFLLGYIGNLAAYLFISRIAFIYHHLPSLVFGILMLAIFYEKILQPALSAKADKILYASFLGLCLLLFLILCPINYGVPLPSSGILHNFYQTVTSFFM